MSRLQNLKFWFGISVEISAKCDTKCDMRINSCKDVMSNSDTLKCKLLHVLLH